ncbi:MAG: Ig-like domain-containing protein [Gemmatimonadaceae bacterium]
MTRPIRCPSRARGQLPLVALLALGVGCTEKVSPNRVASVAVSAPEATPLLVGPGGGQTRQYSAAALNASGEPVTTATITWSVTAPSVISVSSAGLVTALAVGTGYVRAAVPNKADSALVTVQDVPVASVTISPDAVELETGPLGNGNQQLTVVLHDSTGLVLVGRSMTFSSTAPAVASVTSGGLVTGLGAGAAYIKVAVAGRSDSVVATVTEVETLPEGIDAAITGAHWTQGAQNWDGTIPMVREGRAAVVLVTTTTTAGINVPSQFVLRLFTDAGALTYTDTVSAMIPLAATTFATPTVQFLVPSAQLQPGLRWEVERDPLGVLADADASSDVFPRDGHAALALITPPLLRLRFIPVSLTAHGGVTGNVSAANLESYLQLIRAFIPHGQIEATVGSQFPTSAFYGTAPSGAGPTFWTTLLSQLDASRVADPVNADAHWIGIVAPPAGFTFAQNGGWGYIPSNGASYGPLTRTFALINLGWFSDASWTNQLVAHELGHNLGRLHSWCGNPSGPDPGYPIDGGVIGPGAHNTHLWETGLATSAQPIPATTGDMMGYCSPSWPSPYTYEGMLTFRGSVGVALREPEERRHVLLVRGHVENGRATFDPPMTLTAIPSPDNPSGAWTLEGRDANGLVLFSQRFVLGRYDHSESLRPFAVAVPVNAATAAAVATLDVRGPGTAAELRLSP